VNILKPAKAFLDAAGLVFGLRGNTEEPSYSALAALGPVQIRHYAPRLAASVSVPGDEIAARSAGFRILAAYIFGANNARAGISMTAPVAQNAAATEIAMTAPVAQAQTAQGLWEISFFMPAKYTLASIPQPLDPRIRLHETAASTEAVLGFSGVPKAAAVHEAAARLTQQLAGSGWAPSGAIGAQFYDPPWTLPWLRRNEVTVPVSPAA
jgi:hypothetical protein